MNLLAQQVKAPGVGTDDNRRRRQQQLRTTDILPHTITPSALAEQRGVKTKKNKYIRLKCSRLIEVTVYIGKWYPV